MREVFQVDHIVLLALQVLLDVHTVGPPYSFDLGVDTLADILRMVHVEVVHEIAEHSKGIELRSVPDFARFQGCSVAQIMLP